jgi:hypothetical protein
MTDRIGPYEILGRLGSGGMGTVYRARDTRSNIHVALKLLKDEVAEDSDVVRRFEQEARTLQQLDHPHIVKLLAYGVEEDGTHYIAMELVEGESLAHRLRRGPLPEDELRRIGVAVAAALEAAHAQRIVHRDIKPANILLGADGSIKVTDFGVARLLDETQRTRTGTFLGSLAYAAPETFDGQATFASDRYSLGVVLFEAITGQVPFKSDTPAGMMERHRRQPPDFDHPAFRTSVYRPLVQQLLAKNPRERPPNASELSLAMRTPSSWTPPTVRVEPAEPPTPPAKRRLTLVAAVVAVALVAGGIITFMVLSREGDDREANAAGVRSVPVVQQTVDAALTVIAGATEAQKTAVRAPVATVAPAERPEATQTAITAEQTVAAANFVVAVATQGAEATATAAARPRDAVVANAGDCLNLRTSPEELSDGSNAPVCLPDGTVVRITGPRITANGRDWWPIFYADSNLNGFAAVEYIQER